MGEIIVGERMSKVVDVDHVIELSGDCYESIEHSILNKPLDIPSLTYYSLRRTMPEDFEVEVIWNHFQDIITILTAGRNRELIVTFRDKQMARTDKVVYNRQMIEDIKERLLSPE